MLPQTDNSRASISPSQEPPKRQLLLIDDDRDMAEMLAEYLSPEGFTVQLAYTAKAGLNRAKEGGLVLIILDVMLPDRNGLSVLHEIRQSSRIPVIMLTTRAAVTDKVSGLDAGADDYVPKPFTPLELLARIRTVLRRGQPSRFGSSFLAIDDLILDAGSRTVECDGESIECTAAEFDVLHALASSAGQDLRGNISLASPWAGRRTPVIAGSIIWSARSERSLAPAQMDRSVSAPSAIRVMYTCITVAERPTSRHHEAFLANLPELLARYNPDDRSRPRCR